MAAAENEHRTVMTRERLATWLKATCERADPIRLIFVGFILLLIGLNLWWLHVDQKPFAWDESIHYMGAVGYAEILSQSGPGQWARLLYQSDFYPPLVELAAAIGLRIFGTSPDTAAGANLIYLLGSACLFWLIGKRLFDPWTGGLAALAYLSSAMVGIQSKFLMLDIPLVLFVLAGFYAYLRSNDFKDREWALSYGAIFSLALLTKWSALFYLGFAPAVLAGLAAFRRPAGWRRILVNLGLAYGLALLLAGPWYAVHLLKFLRNALVNLQARGALEGDPVLLSWSSATYYIRALFRQLSWPFALLVLGGIVAFVRRRMHLALFGAWIGIPYLILTMLQNKDDRYTLPLLSLLCLAGLAWTMNLREPGRTRVRIAIALAAVGQLALVHLGAGSGWVGKRLTQPVLGATWIDARPPDPRPWPHRTILEDVERLSANGRPTLRVVPDDSAFSQVTFAVARSAGPGAKVLVSSISNWPAFTDFAITKTGGLGPSFMLRDRLPIHTELMNSPGAGNPFRLVRKYPLPDGSDALLYQRLDALNPRAASQILRDIEARITVMLADYVRGTNALTLEIRPESEIRTRQGRIGSIRIKAKQGYIGDYKHKDLGVPFRELDVQLTGIRLDLDRWYGGEVVIYGLDEFEVKTLILDQDEVNAALARDRSTEKVSLEFTGSGIRANWREKVPVQAEINLRVVPDRRLDGSENIWFDLRFLRVGFLTIPGKCLSPLTRDFNPLINLAGFPVKVRLGRITTKPGSLVIAGRE